MVVCKLSDPSTIVPLVRSKTKTETSTGFLGQGSNTEIGEWAISRRNINPSKNESLTEFSRKFEPIFRLINTVRKLYFVDYIRYERNRPRNMNYWQLTKLESVNKHCPYELLNIHWRGNNHPIQAAGRHSISHSEAARRGHRCRKTIYYKKMCSNETHFNRNWKWTTGFSKLNLHLHQLHGAVTFSISIIQKQIEN